MSDLFSYSHLCTSIVYLPARSQQLRTIVITGTDEVTEAQPTPRPKFLKAAGAPRPSTAKHRKPHGRPNQAIAMRKRWADPEYRAKQIEGRQRTALDRVRHPDKYSRAGIPNGMRKAEAQALWDEASTLADGAMKRLEEQGVVERVVVPDTDDAIAKSVFTRHSRCHLDPGTSGSA